MMSNKGNVEETLQCPYDKSHQILKHRMQVHLVRCQRNHPDVRIATCTFNATHRVQEPELKYHLSVCPDRLLLDKFTFKGENVEGADVKFPIPKLDIAPTESWDDLESVPTYDPNEYCKSNPVLRNNIHTQSAARRRNFHMEERVRLQQFDNLSNGRNQQENQFESNQKQRRPAGKSAGIPDNQVDKLHITEVMKELELNAEVITTPKIPLPLPSMKDVTNLSAPDSSKNLHFNKDYPPLTSNVNGVGPKSAPWSAAGLAMNDLAMGYGSTQRSRGRGSYLAKKN